VSRKVCAPLADRVLSDRVVSGKRQDCSYLDSGNVGVLGDVLVLVKALLGDLALAERDAQLDKLEHDRLEGGEGDITRPLGDDHIVKSLQGTSVLADGDELYGVQPEQKNASDEYRCRDAEREGARYELEKAYRCDAVRYLGAYSGIGCEMDVCHVKGTLSVRRGVLHGGDGLIDGRMDRWREDMRWMAR